MNRSLVLVATLFLALPFAGMAQTSMQTASLSTPMTPREVHSLMRSAHDSAQYKQIAGYFHQQESMFRAEAAAEAVERDRRAPDNAALYHYQKYPRPYDTAQSLYESYLSKADSAATQAQHFDQLAAAKSQNDQQLASTSQDKL
ncbi:MAG: hypothetical protein ABR889_06860 [Acidobacteriaceae bacterium]|jgi:hypothetical protein